MSARNGNKKLFTIGRFLVVLLLFIAFFTTYLVIVGRGVVSEVLSKEARAMVTDIINSSNEQLQKLDVLYEDYFSVHYDEGGCVDSISANTGLINQVNMIIQTDVQNRLNSFRVLTVNLPFGALTGSAMLSGFGITVPIRAQVVGNCYTVLKSEFTEYGINNTLHRLQINLFVELEMVVPTKTIVQDVNNEILVAETVISGKVPSTYLGENTDTNYLDLLPEK